MTSELYDNPVNTSREYRQNVAGNFTAVRRALEQIKIWLAPLGISQLECGEVELVLAEVMNNVVEHAFEQKPDGVINLQISFVQGGLDCVVRDNGRSILEGSLPNSDQPELTMITEDLPEGGFGWFLIRDLTQKIECRCGGGRNQLSFHIPQEIGQKSDISH